jgi:hypothetical protein
VLKGGNEKITLEFIMKTLTLALLTLAFTGTVMASDLTEDLKTKFEPLTNPFGNVAAVDLDKGTESQLVELFQRCAFQKVHKDQAGLEIYELSELKTECLAEITPSYSQDRKGNRYIDNRLDIHTKNGLVLTVVTWDGDDSDGGDQQALGVYNKAGARIAVYPSLYVDGNVVDGIIHAINETTPIVRE